MNSLLSFSAFLLWLWTFPMDGKLSQLLNIENITLYFLPFHTVALLSFFFVKKDVFYKISTYFIVVTAILTAIFPFFTKYYQIVMPLIGIFSAAFVIKATLSLKSSKNPLFTALLGFVIASLLQLSICFIVISNIYISFFAAALLPIFSLKSYMVPEDSSDYEDNVFIYSPFVFFFYMIGGIMYSFILPQYNKVCFFEGFEIIYYIIALTLGFMLIRIDKVFAIFGGIVCGMLAFSLFKVEKTLFLNISMIFLQAAFGFVEIFLISTIISGKDSIKAISIIFSAMCMGIVAGMLITLYLYNLSEVIATYGNISLVISTLILVIIERKKIKDVIMSREAVVKDVSKTEPPVNIDIETSAGQIITKEHPSSFALPENSYVKALKKRLSQKEFLVLELILQKKTYKEVAACLGISESTVKTYVRRIYEKENIKSIDKLVERIFKTAEK